MAAMTVWPGYSSPLGATVKDEGVNFAIFSENAANVELCLFDSPNAEIESHRIPLPEKTSQVWHGFLPDAKPGQIYGYRVHGPFDPSRGDRFNARKVLLDPYAKLIARDLRWDHAVQEQERDSAPFAPLASVVDKSFQWDNDRAPRTPWHDTIVYELHAKGFTKQHPDVPERLRGTYAGLVSPATIEHLQSLGVTAVELLPVHYHIDERFLIERNRVNYWGYNTLGFFAPDPRYAASGPEGAVREFKEMVKQFHRGNIEVILDVVYNHTAEGDHKGPTLSLRGIDNAAYYRLADDRSRYVDFTGCGNSLNVAHPRTLQLIMDSLRYWVQEMHVDGFRFDLASALARELWEVDRLSTFFDIIQQDPILSEVKLIAEPWDLGPSGYQVGNFPVLWTEWNGKYRDCVRRFWKGDGGTLGELASRLSGSSDLYAHNGRRPSASLNFITAHDGFTLRDLVSYNQKHNEANGEENRDGTNNNNSWNCGSEGPTDDRAINALRLQQQRNFLATLLLSQGVPMLLAGDEFGHSARHKMATTMRIARIRRLPGSTGISLRNSALCSTSFEISCTYAKRSPFFVGVTFFRVARFMARRLKICTGSSPTAQRCRTAIGSLALHDAWAWFCPATRSRSLVNTASELSEIHSPCFSIPVMNQFHSVSGRDSAAFAGRVCSTPPRRMQQSAHSSS
jgi:isoamylase